jgi:hypothetical protein
MRDQDYPALFRIADSASNASQKQYLRLIQLEYVLLLLAASLSTVDQSNHWGHKWYALIFLFLVVVLVLRAFLKPVQDWYRSRAIAESIKTLTWRYMMRASPFDGAMEHSSPPKEFSSHLKGILDLNRDHVGKLDVVPSAEQITATMDRVRSFALSERSEFYREFRVEEQLDWYLKKAKHNRREAKRWVVIGIGAYALAAALVVGRAAATNWNIWPIEPVIVFASSIIGWVQIKKFGELAAAYSVTAQEIGLIKPRLSEKAGDTEFSEYVNEAELAFSREHTFWLARQTG